MQRYNLRSTSNKRKLITSSLSPSPLSSPTSSSISNSDVDRESNVKRRMRRKRKFSDFSSDSNDNETVDTNHNNPNNTKKSKKTLSNKAKAKQLSPEPMATSRTIPGTAATDSRIEDYEITITSRSRRRHAIICCYEFFNGYRIGINMVLGNARDVKHGIKLLSQDLVSKRAKLSLHTRKNTFLAYIKNTKQELIACSILLIDVSRKRVHIEMFAVDQNWRGNGFASLLIYVIQYRMLHYNDYDLYVCAANSAVPFWLNKKYQFMLAKKHCLDQNEIEDEKHGGTKHLIWFGSAVQARNALLQCFMQTNV